MYVAKRSRCECRWANLTTGVLCAGDKPVYGVHAGRWPIVVLLSPGRGGSQEDKNQSGMVKGISLESPDRGDHDGIGPRRIRGVPVRSEAKVVGS